MLLEIEADSVRSSIANAVKHVKTFHEEVSDYTHKLLKVVLEIEGRFPVHHNRVRDLHQIIFVFCTKLQISVDFLEGLELGLPAPWSLSTPLFFIEIDLDAPLFSSLFFVYLFLFICFCLFVCFKECYRFL